MKTVDAVMNRGLFVIFSDKIKRLLTFALLGAVVYFVNLFFIKNRLIIANIMVFGIPDYALRRMPYGALNLCLYCCLGILSGEIVFFVVNGLKKLVK